MNDHRSSLYFLLGAWISFVSLVTAGTILLPPAPGMEEASGALLYKIASNETLTHREFAVSGRSIVADLDAMTMTLFEDNVSKKTFPILSKGREGTFWETPTGVYEIGVKEPKHFSSIGGTWMPYSLQFYGNFFIHGWPTYPDGTPVAKGYSGGCIRLGTDDAREVYSFAALGTKVSVVGGLPPRAFATSSQYYLRVPGSLSEADTGSSSLPTVLASSFIVADVDSGDILWQRAAQAPVRPNGLVSVVTALTALETVNQYKFVRMGDLLLDRYVTSKHAKGAADELSLGSLIYPLLFDTSDTAAKAFANEHGPRTFTRSMNQKTLAIGMDATTWSGALSSDPATSTPRDLLLLLQYVNAHKHFIIDVTLSSERTFVSEDGSTTFTWENKNPWLRAGDAAYRGGIGTLRPNGSGSALVLFALPVSEFSDRTIAVVIPESSDIMGDVQRLRGFVVKHFVYGIERDASTFVREKEEPTPSLLFQIKRVLDLRRFLDEETEYQREV